ncbi:nucleobase:cation symporter-2 family protein [Streptomyces caniscabiei]|uniref:Purine permease n=1 Tax=Streptomyces caniscabiei TaxID=2746961 RepID=A0A927QQW3_9ACTN|nr:nucleobase:cation symporter-2 family protein [Streptomyces caniscabiei]MBD9728999.1 purine permease [Streptomyces caniscabiei]MDX3514433.1 nucleobase:cation symporter-2 family protein [Streptomyces caniscabiei]MDX3719933.1 nucleobase:cation symporter-2 family protein [Streptomyces caniscabiei]MDX3731088.1 nucleobase:cation symporter-2 family protein [Streptomyces caniscabiei]WEO29057.1 nucleobase:cation symporter-2 family protein [Streptomyces caniscabiei]
MASTTPTHPVDDVPPIRHLLAFGLQHVLAMYAGAVAVPLVVGGALRLPPADLAYLITADLLVCGIATLIQCVGVWRFGVRLPIMQGCTFAAVSPMVLIGTEGGGLPAIYGSVIVAGLAIMLLAPVFGRLLRFFPPLVTGTVILVIGLSLLPVAGNWAAGGVGASDFGAPRNLALAAFVLLVVVGVQRFAPVFLSRIAVLVGIVVGLAVAVPLGFTDFGAVRDAGWLGVSTPFHFGAPVFQLSAILSMLVVALVTMTETTGDLIAVGELTGREVEPRSLADGLRADGFSTVLGGVFNTFPYTAYAQNVGLVGMTRVRSRWVVAAAGGILVLLGLLPKLGAVVAAIPAPVLGGAGLVMFGTVAASGLRTLARVEFRGNDNLTVVAVSVAVGLLPVGVPSVYAESPEWFRTVMNSGISAGCLTAITLNLLFNHRPAKAGSADAETGGLPGDVVEAGAQEPREEAR